MTDFFDPNELPADEVEKPAPKDRGQNAGWSDLVRPLVGRIAQLESNRCIRLKKSLTSSLVSAIRSVLEHDHGYKLIMRSMPGETYFWRGEKIVGTVLDMEKRNRRVTVAANTESKPPSEQ